jgi:hypothetical protein
MILGWGQNFRVWLPSSTPPSYFIHTFQHLQMHGRTAENDNFKAFSLLFISVLWISSNKLEWDPFMKITGNNDRVIESDQLGTTDVPKPVCLLAKNHITECCVGRHIIMTQIQLCGKRFDLFQQIYCRKMFKN